MTLWLTRNESDLIAARHGSVVMHSIDCRRANLDRNKNSYYPVQILRLSRSKKIDHTLSINDWLENLQCQLISWLMKRTCYFVNYFCRITIIAGKDSRACVTLPQNDTCMFDLSSIAIARTKLLAEVEGLAVTYLSLWRHQRRLRGWRKKMKERVWIIKKNPAAILYSLIETFNNSMLYLFEDKITIEINVDGYF